MKPDPACCLLGTQSRPAICCLIGSGESGAVASVGAVTSVVVNIHRHTEVALFYRCTIRHKAVVGVVMCFCANSLLVVKNDVRDQSAAGSTSSEGLIIGKGY